MASGPTLTFTDATPAQYVRHGGLQRSRRTASAPALPLAVVQVCSVAFPVLSCPRLGGAAGRSTGSDSRCFFGMAHSQKERLLQHEEPQLVVDSDCLNRDQERLQPEKTHLDL